MKNVIIRSEKANPKNATSRLLQAWGKRGYADVMAGKGFDPEYNHIGPNRQLNYENGRLKAASVLALRGRLRKSLTALLVVGQLAGCASAHNRAALDHYKVGCAQGNANDCATVPHQERANRDDAMYNGLKVVGVALLLPLIVLAAVADARACAKFGYC